MKEMSKAEAHIRNRIRIERAINHIQAAVLDIRDSEDLTPDDWKDLRKSANAIIAMSKIGNIKIIGRIKFKRGEK